MSSSHIVFNANTQHHSLFYLNGVSLLCTMVLGPLSGSSCMYAKEKNKCLSKYQAHTEQGRHPIGYFEIMRSWWSCAKIIKSTVLSCVAFSD